MASKSKMYQGIFISLVISLCLACLSLAKNVFSVDLIYRDSIFSPFYNRSQTSSELLRNAVYRSFYSLNHSNSYMSTHEKYIETSMNNYDYNTGNYMISLPVGNSYKFLAFATFGSSFIWMNCFPCTYSHDGGLKLPLFDLAYRSEHYSKVLHRDVVAWNNLEVKLAEGRGGVCTYAREGTAGILIKEAFNLGLIDDGTPPLFVLGCSDTTTTNLKGLVQGYVGLGSGELSFPYQLGRQADHIYSYCLIPRSSTTNTNAKIRFGHQNKNFETRVSTTYILQPTNPYYFLGLEGISVGGHKRLTSQYHYDHIMLDAGRTATLLPRHMFDFVHSKMISVIHISPIEDATHKFNLCYRVVDKDHVYSLLPTVELYFDETTVLKLQHANIFVEYDYLICLAFIPNDDGVYLLGNIAQSNFQVEYKLQTKSVSFAPTDCTSW